MKKRIRKIFSLNLICYLRCNGLKEDNIGFNEDTKKVYFIYEDTKKLEKMIEAYRDKDAMVRLHDFTVEFKQLKEEMYHHMKEFTK